jgi:predicted amidohydrolase YtcJ
MIPKTSFSKLALLGGNIVTIDEKRPRAQAVYVLGDRIAKVGSDSEIRPFTLDARTMLFVAQRE